MLPSLIPPAFPIIDYVAPPRRPAPPVAPGGLPPRRPIKKKKEEREPRFYQLVNRRQLERTGSGIW